MSLYAEIIEEKRYIQEVVNPENGNHYMLNVVSYVPDSGILNGMHCVELYLCDSDLTHDVKVGIGKKAFPPEEYTQEEMTTELDSIINSYLPEGFRRFEAIMASGLEGNELRR